MKKILRIVSVVVSVYVLGLLLFSQSLAQPVPKELGSTVVNMYKHLQNLSSDEKRTLSELLALSEALQRGKEKAALLEKENAALTERIAQSQEDLEKATLYYQETRSKAGEAVRVLQRMGPVSYVELLSGAASWQEFWQRLDLITAAMGGVQKNLTVLQDERDHLLSCRQELTEKQQFLQANMKKLSDEISAYTQLAADKELFLSGLGKEGVLYEARLQEIETVWIADTIPFLKAAAQELSERLYFDEEDYNSISWGMDNRGLVIKIPYALLNKRLSALAMFEGASFSCQNSRIRMEIPSRALILEGNLAVQEERIIYIEASKIYLDGIELSQDCCSQVFKETPMRLDLGPFLNNLKINDVQSNQEGIVLHLG